MDNEKPQLNQTALVIMSVTGMVFLIFMTSFSYWKVKQNRNMAKNARQQVAGEQTTAPDPTPTLPDLESKKYRIIDQKINIK